MSTAIRAMGTLAAGITANDAGAMTHAELAAIVANPRAHYVNVHTTQWPAGEVRGQLK